MLLAKLSKAVRVAFCLFTASYTPRCGKAFKLLIILLIDPRTRGPRVKKG